MLERIPADTLAWKPHEKSISLGQLALHVAQIPGAIAGFVSTPSFAMTVSPAQDEATWSAEVLEALDASVARAKEVLNGLDDLTVSTRGR